MEKLLKKGHSGIIAQFNAIQVVDTPPQEIHLDLQLVLSKHQQVFETNLYSRKNYSSAKKNRRSELENHNLSMSQEIQGAAKDHFTVLYI
jgi:hypothetical protein